MYELFYKRRPICLMITETMPLNTQIDFPPLVATTSKSILHAHAHLVSRETYHNESKHLRIYSSQITKFNCETEHRTHEKHGKNVST